MTYDTNPPAYIYVLLDPSTKNVRYVGCSEEPAKRYKRHVSEARMNVRRFDAEGHPACPSQKDRWICGLLENGAEPLFAIVETTDRTSRKEVEARWVEKLESEGHSLLNIEVLRRHKKEAEIFQKALDLGKDLFT